MKKVIALMVISLGIHMTAYAHAQQNSYQQVLYSSQTDNATNANDQSAPESDNKDNEAAIGGGSGDDAGTPNEADPRNDNDPEADKAPSSH